MKSIRWTALIWIAAVLAPIALAASVIAYLVGREESDFVFDGMLVQIATHLDPEMHEILPMPLLHDPEDEFVVSVWDADGRLVRDTSDGVIPRQIADGFVNMTIGGVTWRIFTAHAAGRTLQVAQRQEVREEVAEHLALSAALPVLAALPLVWGLVAFALSRLFRQLDNTSIAVARRDVHTTDLLRQNDVPVEMRAFVEAMNELLERQAAAIEQQRRFVSDAAHELRTPLTALQILVDTLAERAARDGSAEGDVVNELGVALGRARALINQLLKLAELDSGSERQTTTKVDLRDVLMDVIATLMPLASRKGMEFLVDARETATALAAPADIQTLFSVLVDNAVRYGPDGSPVDIQLLAEHGATVFEVRNRGDGIPVEALDRIYDRFFRLAPHSIEGTGLGLAIAKSIAERYRFELVISNHPSGGVSAKVAFPAHAGAPAKCGEFPAAGNPSNAVESLASIAPDQR